MVEKISVSKVMNSLIPISRFNKGEANKIFEEVKASGFKIVVKNNIPACVLLTPEAYEQLLEVADEYQLLLEAEKRMESYTPRDLVSRDKVLSEFGLDESDLGAIDVELE